MKLRTIINNKKRMVEDDAFEFINLTSDVTVINQDMELYQEAHAYAEKYGYDNPVIQDIFGNILSIGTEGFGSWISKTIKSIIAWIKGVLVRIKNFFIKLFGGTVKGEEEDKEDAELTVKLLTAGSDGQRKSVMSDAVNKKEQELTKDIKDAANQTTHLFPEASLSHAVASNLKEVTKEASDIKNISNAIIADENTESRRQKIHDMRLKIESAVESVKQSFDTIIHSIGDESSKAYNLSKEKLQQINEKVKEVGSKIVDKSGHAYRTAKEYIVAQKNKAISGLKKFGSKALKIVKKNVKALTIFISLVGLIFQAKKISPLSVEQLVKMEDKQIIEHFTNVKDKVNVKSATTSGTSSVHDNYKNYVSSAFDAVKTTLEKLDDAMDKAEKEQVQNMERPKPESDLPNNAKPTELPLVNGKIPLPILNHKFKSVYLAFELHKLGAGFLANVKKSLNGEQVDIEGEVSKAQYTLDKVNKLVEESRNNSMGLG